MAWRSAWDVAAGKLWRAVAVGDVRLGVAPPACLALEDAPLGAAAALAAAMVVVVVPNVFTRALTFPPGAVMAASLMEVSSWMTLG